MANKNYTEFPAGTYDSTKILLQADPTTGELEKIELPLSPQILPYPQPAMGADASLNLDGHSLIATTDGEDGSAGLTMLPDNAESYFSIYLPSALRGVFNLLKDSFGWSMNVADGNNGMVNFRPDELQLAVTDIASLGISMKLASMYFNATDYFVFTEFLEYADNAAALSAGLPLGALYRTGDAVKQVHS